MPILPMSCTRERLCLRGTTDYWVNDAVGRPFFVVSKAVTEGLADALLKDIAAELLLSVGAAAHGRLARVCHLAQPPPMKSTS